MLTAVSANLAWLGCGWAGTRRAGVEQVLNSVRASPDGLSTIEAMARQPTVAPIVERNVLWRMVAAQVQTLIAGILLVGAGVSAALGSPLDVLLIVATLGTGVAVVVWRERRTGQAATIRAPLVGLGEGNMRREKWTWAVSYVSWLKAPGRS